MATHHCISNPCWICYPEYAPKAEEKNFSLWQGIIQDRFIPERGISGVVRDVLVEVFNSGLGEDAHYRATRGAIGSINKITLADLKIDRTYAVEGSLEAQLLDMMIADFESKGDDY